MAETIPPSGEIPVLPASLINGTLGALLLGQFFTTLFYGILSHQCYHFFQRFTQEGRLLKYSIWTLWAFETVHLVLTVHPVYVFLVTDYGQLAIVLSTAPVPWSIAAGAFLVALGDNIVRSWFAWRLWILSEKNRVLLAVSVVLMLIDFVLTFVLGVKIAIIPKLAYLNQLNWLFYWSFTVPAVSDLYTALALSYFLYRKRSKVNRRTYSIMNVLMVYTINTGLLTSLVCFLVMATHAAMPKNFVFLGVYFPLTGLYSNALLGSLNARDWFRRDTRPSSIIPLSSMSSGSKPAASRDAINLHGQSEEMKASGCMGTEETKVVL